MIRLIPLLVFLLLAVACGGMVPGGSPATPAPRPTPDISAIVDAQVQAQLAAMPTPAVSPAESQVLTARQEDVVSSMVVAGRSTVASICDDYLKTVINPRTGSFGATTGQVNDAIIEVQTRYPQECHYTDWNPAVWDGQTFGDGARESQCFSDQVSGVGVAMASRAAIGDVDKLYVGLAPVPDAFYDTDDTGLIDTPRGETQRDSAGNVIVFFDAENGFLPWDYAHCWLFRAGRLNQWFSNVPLPEEDFAERVPNERPTVPCDYHLKTVINPRTGSFGATSKQVNEAVLEVQLRYPQECHHTNWNPVARDGQTFGTGTGENQCFSDGIGSSGVAMASRSAVGDIDKLYVGQIAVPNEFYDTSADGLVDTPVGRTRRDSAGNVIVFFDAENMFLPWEGTHCWLYRSDHLNQWYSNAPSPEKAAELETFSLVEEAGLLFNQGRYLEAIAKYEEAEEKHGGHIGIAQNLMGHSQLQLGNYDLAIQHFTNQIGVLDDGLARINRAAAYLYSNLCPEAVDDARVALGMEPEVGGGFHSHAEAHLTLADCFVRTGDYSLALEHVDSAIALALEHGFSDSRIDSFSLKESSISDIADGLAYLEDYFSGHAREYAHSGKAYFEQGLYEQAIDSYESAVERHWTDSGQLFSFLGNSYSRLGLHQEALGYFSRAIEVRGDSYNWVWRAIEYLNVEGGCDMAFGDANVALVYPPFVRNGFNSHSAAFFITGRCWFYYGDLDLALTYIEEAIRLAGESGVLLGEIALMEEFYQSLLDEKASQGSPAP